VVPQLHAHKHARATRATITLVWDATVRVCVEDDGVGFGAPAAAFTYGLAGMHERAAAPCGRLELENRPSGGARGGRTPGPRRPGVLPLATLVT
jgi:signal transduction histidine kinase